MEDLYLEAINIELSCRPKPKKKMKPLTEKDENEIMLLNIGLKKLKNKEFTEEEKRFIEKWDLSDVELEIVEE